MTPALRGQLALIEAEWAEAQAAPLSLRRALLVAAMIDVFSERVHAAWREAEDVLAFRAELAAACPALAAIAELCAMRPEGPRLVVRSVEVPIAEYHRLGVEDYMVSLYNANTVQRVALAGPEGERLAHEVIGEAVAWWRARLEAA